MCCFPVCVMLSADHRPCPSIFLSFFTVKGSQMIGLLVKSLLVKFCTPGIAKTGVVNEITGCSSQVSWSTLFDRCKVVKRSKASGQPVPQAHQGKGYKALRLTCPAAGFFNRLQCIA